jgi:hypothetical protein
LQWHSDEELLVGKIIDNGILLASWMIVFLHQNQLCNHGPILTLFESLVVFLLMAIVLGMTERNHKKEATIDHLLAHLSPAAFFLLSVSATSVV